MLVQSWKNFIDNLLLPPGSLIDKGAHRFALCLVVLPALVLMFFLWKPWIHGNDGVRHYVYCRSAWLDLDFNFTNEFSWYMARGELQKITIDQVTGLPGNSQGCGSAVLWSPFFWLGHLVALITPYATNGYSAPYVWAVCAGTSLYAIAGLALLTSVLVWRFGILPALLSIYAIWLGSPLLFYMYLHPSMSHGCSFFLAALLVWMFERWRNIQFLWHFFVIAMVAGLAMATRINNGVLLLAPLAFWGRALYSGLPEEDRFYRRRGIYYAGLMVFLGLFVGFFPQMLAWRIFYDAWLSGPRDYNLDSNISLTASPYFFRLFISGWRGLFVWSPALFPGFIGMFILLKRKRFLDWALVLAFLAQAWVIGGWAYWYGGASFGQRFFINMLPILAIGLAWFVLCLREGKLRALLIAYILVSILWSGGLMIQYGSRMIDREGPVLTRELVRNQFTRVPRKLGEYIRYLLPETRMQSKDRPEDEAEQ
ncbi:MAG: hypothetical protein ACLFUS_09885 [Candidatus Sumerlaeia bacterium]